MSHKALVIGAGGREHALGVALARDGVEVTACPGNPGMVGSGIALAEDADPLQVVERVRPDLVVVGPEAPLCEGLVDQLAERGVLTFGPSRAAAELEGSKVFMKEFAKRHELPTARYEVVRSERDVESAVKSFAAPPVVKADGLCAGKGVTVAGSHEEAIAEGKAMLSGQRFGRAGTQVVIEERLLGQEASVHAICDGERVLLLTAAQDHKRIGDNDTGPNTGGMGTYAPAPVVTNVLAKRIRETIIEPAVRGMAQEGRPYRGVLFAGLMIAATGEPRLLEFNVRFGDPETQVLTAVTDGNWFEALRAAAEGHLAPDMLTTGSRHAVCVVLAAAGYPGAPRKGDVIEGLGEAAALPGVQLFHAGTALRGNGVVTAGGRVLGVTAVGESLREAHERAYAAAKLVRFAGKQMRQDIAARALR